MPGSTLRARLRAVYLLAVLAGRVLLLAFIALLLFTQAQERQTVTLPAPAGPYAVGRVAYDWVDETRADPFSPNASAKRELMVWVWYPALPALDAAPAAYLPGKWGQLVEERNNPFLAQDLNAIRVHAIADASVATASAPYPVLIMSPGFGLLPTDLTALAEDLASRGYVVAGIAPTFIAPRVVFPDGRVAEQGVEAKDWANASSLADVNILGDKLVTRMAQDVSFVMDQFGKLNGDSSSQFAGHLDTGRIGVFGHSLGGAVSAQSCRMDKRCQAGIDLDGAPYGDVITAGLKQPFMFVLSERPAACDEFCAEANRDRQTIYDRLPVGYKLTINGFDHFNFTDFAVEYSPLARAEGLLGPIDGRRGLKISADYIGAFFDKYLKNAPAPLLDAASPAYPEVQFERR